MAYIAVDYEMKTLEVLQGKDFLREEADRYFTQRYGNQYMGMFIDYNVNIE